MPPLIFSFCSRKAPAPKPPPPAAASVTLHAGDDPMLQAIEGGDLSTEAVVRMLKTKVTLMQEDAALTAEALAERDTHLKEALQRCVMFYVAAC